MGALAFALLIPGCSREEVATDLTGIELEIRFPTGEGIDQFQISAHHDRPPAESVLSPSLLPGSPGAPFESGRETVVILVSDALAGERLRLRVDGLAGGAVIASGEAVVTLALGVLVFGTVDLDIAATCGDGRISAPETCDDGNTDPSDGCDPSCRVEAGWGCQGEPSVCTELLGCGDGAIEAPEQCDDGNPDPSDGCDPSCRVEAGWSCSGEPSVCVQDCSDGVCDLAGGEDHQSCPADCGWVDLAPGDEATCGVKADGTVWCWGDNSVGQLGDGSTTASLTPVQVSGLGDIVAITSGRQHVCAMAAAGGIWCWGSNDTMGLLGNGTTGGFSAVPLPVSGIGDARYLDAGSQYTCAIRSDDTIWCWGLNSSGRLGDGTSNNRPQPAQVSGFTDAATVAGRTVATCALTQAGAPWCWGGNANGQLGDGTTSGSFLPVPVTGLPAVVAGLEAGWNFSCAYDPTGNGYCWGMGDEGRLATGGLSSSLVPTPMSFAGPIVDMDLGGVGGCVGPRHGRYGLVLGPKRRRPVRRRDLHHPPPRAGPGRRPHQRGLGARALAGLRPRCRPQRLVLGRKSLRRAGRRHHHRPQRAGRGDRPLLTDT